jgi:hypothetical protein
MFPLNHQSGMHIQVCTDLGHRVLMYILVWYMGFKPIICVIDNTVY